MKNILLNVINMLLICYIQGSIWTKRRKRHNKSHEWNYGTFAEQFDN